MVFHLGPLYFENPIGALALLAILPLIILYLVRPKPKSIEIPSLMFFIKSHGSKKLTSFLKQVTRDWLFVIQLLILLLLCLTFLQPFNFYQYDITSQNTVIVLDVSASSQTLENGKTRFDIGIKKAKESLGSKNTLILAKGVPKIALQDVSSSEIKKYLNKLQPTESTSQIGEAIILAGETLLGKEGRVIVISDFINTGGQDPYTAQGILKSRKITVDFINTATLNKNNIGIVGIEPGNQETTIYIKNFMDKTMKVPLKIAATKKEFNIPKKSVETYTFQTPEGANKIELLIKDDLQADNIAYLSSSAKDKTKVLLITNNESIFLSNALQASGDTLVEISKPPVIAKGDYDVYIVHNIDLKELIPGTFEEIEKRVEKGASVIIHAQSNSDNINYKDLIPVKIQDKTGGGFIQTDQLNSFTKNIEFGSAKFAFKTEPESNTITIASINENPIIVLKQDKISKFIYFGIPEESEFKYSTSYPIFWTELMKFLTSKQDAKNLNYKTGETLILDKEQVIQTPTKKVKKSSLILDQAGLYELEDRIIAVSLANEKESNTNPVESKGTQSINYELKPIKEQREYYWANLLLSIAILLLLFELYFIKKRGEL